MSKSILITGASRGIGASVVRELFFNSEDYSTFILVARKSDDFLSLIEEVKNKNKNENNKKIIHFFCDFSDRKEVEVFIKKILDLGINIDCLVNNAGYTQPDPIHQIKMEDFDKTLNVNLISPFLIVQSLLRKENKFELVINIASTAGMNGRAGWLTYSASKAAVINMSEVMRDELRMYGTRVVCLAPGRCATDLRKKLAPDEDPSTIMQPEHVASVIAMIAGPVGKYIDSQNLVVRL
ncbi:MAG: SDR family oxidoreductase [Paenalcaligenes sp.]